MYYLMEKARHKRCKGGFTLVELLVVIVVLAVLAAIVLPKFVNSSKRSKEAALKSDLKLLRNAINLFQTDTGLYPQTLDDLAATSAPAKGLDSAGLDANLVAADWHGPYLQDIPKDPVSGEDLKYAATGMSAGEVRSSATGNGLDGTAYSDW